MRYLRKCWPWAVGVAIVGITVFGMTLHDPTPSPQPSVSGSSVPVSDSHKKMLCPFGTGAKACVDVQSADVDGDGAKDLASVAFNNDLSTGMIHVFVRFSTGEVSSEQLYFGDDSRVADAASSKVSFLGFADINGQPGQEIFVRMFVGGHWNFSVIQYRGAKSIQNGSTHFAAGGTLPDGPDVSYVGFTNAAGMNGEIVADGLRYADFGAHKNVLIVWIVSRYPDGSFDVHTVGYMPASGSYEYQEVPDGTTDTSFLPSDADKMTSVIDHQRAITSPGFIAG